LFTSKKTYITHPDESVYDQVLFVPAYNTRAEWTSDCCCDSL